MKVNISVKGVSNRQAKICTIEYCYPDAPMTLRELIRETVRLDLEDYAASALDLLTEAQIGEQSQSGKVGFGIHYNNTPPDREAATENAILSFIDGRYAVFLDGTRLLDLDEVVPVHEGSSLAFVRLTFLAGRMW